MAWAISVVLAACTPGEHPFLMVQLCLGNESGVAQFKEELHAIARDEHMRYIDHSRATEQEIKALDASRHADGKLINVGVVDDSGPGLTAGNLGLNAYDVAVGFSRGRDSQAAHAFSQRVVARLKQRWTLQVVPAGTGAFPDPRCLGETKAPSNNSFKGMPLRGTP